MYLSRPPESTCIFRSQAWGHAWLDAWGKNKGIQLIDFGGKQNPREMLYRTTDRVKKILPVDSLHLIGVASRSVSTPRAEYNDISELVAAVGSVSMLLSELKKLSWGRFCLPDLSVTAKAEQMLLQFAGEGSWALHELRTEPAYYIAAKDFPAYLNSLGANTRLAYFNRRERLSQIGKIEFVRYPLVRSFEFFVRWGRPCYSQESQWFLNDFMERLSGEGGVAILEAMQINGEIVSVLYDVELAGCRYNFQSGYRENKFPKIALGAIHMGYGIQAAIESGSFYDFMAGEGKNSNYKARIATHQELIKSVNIECGRVKHLRRLKNMLANPKDTLF